MNFLTRDDLRRRGWSPKAIAALAYDHTEKVGRYCTRYLYEAARIEDIEKLHDHWRKRSVTPKPADAAACDILAALWAINRRAKRCRDTAQANYLAGTHGFARTAREEKEQMYRLKSQCLHYLLAEGKLTVSGYHRNESGLWMEILRGQGDSTKPDGYTYHRPCPEPQTPVEADTVSVEAKPRDKREPRLKDALACVRAYLEGKATVEVYQWPRRVRNVQCYNCGGYGHIAAECPDQDEYDFEEDEGV